MTGEVLHPADDLATLAANQAQEIAALQSELDETNRGVLALYAELDTQAQQLRQATELKSRFLAYMSHEFRTPLSTFRSLARLLLDEVDGPLTSEQRRQVEFIRTTASEFSDMVDDLLDLAKVEAGRIDISAEWFDMLDLFSALRGMFKPVLTNPDVTLIFEEPQQSVALFTDDKKLSQILRNFISNALKFTIAGEIRVSATMDPGDIVTFSVADSGIGISPEFLSTIFHDYAQINSPIQTRLRGTGLGLSLSKRLAELLGGRVGVRSQIGQGSTFFITLPARLPQDSAALPSRLDPEPGIGNSS